MKRILVINTASTSFNGVTSVILNYTRNSHQTVSYDFILCGRVDEYFVNEFNKLGHNVFLSPCSRVKKPLSYFSWLKKIMKSNPYDAIHAHGNSGTLFLEMHAAKKAGVPIRIAHSHNTSCKYMLAHKCLKKPLNRELTQAIACSDLAGKWLFTKDYLVLQNGIDMKRFSFAPLVRTEYRESMNLKDCLTIGHVAYMDTEKNHLYLLRIMEALIKRNDNVRLLMIGDGRLRPEIEAYISEHHMENHVQLLGKRPDVASLYQCMDVFVLPSLYEGLPVTLVEAQAAGLPCIISNRITQEVNLSGTVQYVGIEEADIDTWVDSLLTATRSDEQRAVASGKLENCEFNIQKCIDSLLSCYQVQKATEEIPVQ